MLSIFRSNSEQERMFSAPLEPLLAEQDVPRFFVGWSLAGALDFIFHHRQSVLNRRALCDALVSSPQMREILEILTLPKVGP